MDTAIRTASLLNPRLVAPRSRWLLFSTNAICLVGLLVVMFVIDPGTSDMRVGEVAPDTVVAQRNVTYIDRVATSAKRKQVMDAVSTIYRFDTQPARERVIEASGFLSRIAPIIAGTSSNAVKLSEIRHLVPGSISSTALEQIALLSSSAYRQVQERSLALLGQAATWRVDQNQIDSTEIGLLGTLPAGVPPRQRNAIGEVLATFMVPTLVSDFGATQSARRQAAARIPQVTNTIYQGEAIVRRGDLVTPSVMEKLHAVGLPSRRAGWQDMLASTIFSSLIIAMLFWYLHVFQARSITNPRLLLLVDVSILAAVLGARILSAHHVVLPLFLPVGAASTFAAALIAPEACIAITLAMAILAGWVVANSFELTVYYFLSGAAGVFAIRELRQLKQFILAGVYISLFALLTALSFGLIDRTYDLSALQMYVLAAVFNGFVSSTLALGGFALLSEFFGVTTMLQLLELGQPNQPLLRRLMVKAPGTYNHSLIVGSMVERAAEEIGANSLIAKLGALYHDVGKSANPHGFVENQLGMGNIHDEMRPEESARIIRGHVSHGLRLAKQFRLPRVVIEAIAEHHGTMSIAYFLHKALQTYGTDEVDRSLYTYAGPKPQSRETALLMLADGCESAVRASRDHSRDAIDDIVRRIVAERVEQGQLDESPLTMGDLKQIQGAFCSVLNGLYHPRIEYPETADVPTLPKFIVETDIRV